ncbi:unnamed protein product [Clavelina lepadiformis]|uniref:Tetratricopeptide repeat protein n=1 Tax=Clavelina lepadiformis TaxID=159417 RepID=A0ABP0F044_CLALP
MTGEQQQINIPLNVVVHEEKNRPKSVRAPPTAIQRWYEQPSASRMKLSMRDEKISGVPRGHSKLKFSKVFTVYDLTEEYVNSMKEQNFEHAYNVLLKQQVTGYVGFKANHLKNSHEIFLLTGKSELATETRRTMVKLIAENMEVNPDEIREFADQLQTSKKYLDAMLFNFIAAVFYRFTSNSSEKLKKIDQCTFRMAQFIKMFWELETERIKIKSCPGKLKAESNLRSLVRNRLLPMLHEMREIIKTIKQTTNHELCLYDTLCAHRIEYCLGIIEDHDIRERMIRGAIQAMSVCFGPQSEDYQVVGHLLNNLGQTYWCLSKYDPAAMYYNQAIDAYKQSKNYLSFQNKNEDIERSQRNLKLVKIKLN